ncbi:MAG: NosD domain-containing protein [Candidatus Diapherotrites archaeon]
MDISKLAHLAAVAAIILLLLQFASAGTLADVFNAFANLGTENPQYDFDSSGGAITVNDILAALSNVAGFGSVIVPEPPPVEDDCNSAGECGSLTVSDPYCDGENVVQATTTPICVDPATAQSTCATDVTITIAEECQYTCLNGECQASVPIECYSWDECGAIVSGNPYCDANAVMQDTNTPLCLNAGTAQSACDLNISTVTVEECAYGCLDGNCTLSQGECDSAAECGTVSVGLPYCSGSNVVQDTNTPTCTSPGTPQSACDISTSTATLETCQNGCLNGNCLEGGECDSAADCGTVSVGQPYCSGGNVVQDTNSPLCLSPGTPQSACDISTSTATLETCQNGCSEGACQAQEPPAEYCCEGTTCTFSTCTLGEQSGTISCLMKQGQTLTLSALNGCTINAPVENNGQIARLNISNCSNSTFTTGDITSGSYGLYIYTGSSNNDVTVGNIQANGYSFYMKDASNGNTIHTGNVASNTVYGLILSGASGNNITAGNITSTIYDGVVLAVSSVSNTLSVDDITAARRGINIVSSSSDNSVSAGDISSSRDSVYLDGGSNNNTVTAQNIHLTPASTGYYAVTVRDTANSNVTVGNITVDSLSNGVYFYAAKAGNTIRTGNITLLSSSAGRGVYTSNSTTSPHVLVCAGTVSGGLADCYNTGSILMACENGTPITGCDNSTTRTCGEC